MAAIPNAGGARYAPRVVVRALLRAVLLGGLVAVGWLLGSGISYADEDLGQPSPGLSHVANAVPFDDGSDDGFGTPAAVEPIVKQVLSTAAVPRLPVQPPVQVSILRPIVKAVGIAKPLDQVLPVSRPLSGPDQHTAPARHIAAIPPPAQAEKPATVSPAPAVAGQGAAPASAPTLHTKPAMLHSLAQPAAESMTLRPALGDGPVSPMPANPLGSTTSLCTIGGAGGSASSKNGSEVAVHDGWLTDGLTQPYGPLERDTSGLPRSLSVRPSTSPD
ncbi:MAG: hypothetical protein QOG46_1242 [Pseudonocardiales bacterium]|nr:hypothetical protein [Pseudonocardiales bacterium]